MGALELIQTFGWPIGTLMVAVWPDFGSGGGLIGYHGDVVKVS